MSSAAVFGWLLSVLHALIGGGGPVAHHHSIGGGGPVAFHAQPITSSVTIAKNEVARLLIT
jgi:hypothetical protein